MRALFILAALPVLIAAESIDSQKYRACMTAAERGDIAALRAARAWIDAGGDTPARHCLGVAQLRAGNPQEAAATLETAARVAESRGAPLAGQLYAQAGNAALLGGAFEKAERLLSAALVAMSAAPAPVRADVLIDRAQVRMARSAFPEAIADLTAATAARPDNAAAWLYRAAAERRAGDLSAAERSIKQAIAIAPDNPAIIEEAARIAASP